MNKQSDQAAAAWVASQAHRAKAPATGARVSAQAPSQVPHASARPSPSSGCRQIHQRGGTRNGPAWPHARRRKRPGRRQRRRAPRRSRPPQSVVAWHRRNPRGNGPSATLQRAFAAAERLCHHSAYNRRFSTRYQPGARSMSHIHRGAPIWHYHLSVDTPPHPVPVGHIAPYWHSLSLIKKFP